MGESVTRVHYTSRDFVNNHHEIEVLLVGCGGTGSHILGHLARMDIALKELGKPGLRVTAFDPKPVNDINPVRQIFGPADIGRNKAEVMITRMNRFYGTNWKFRAEEWVEEKANRYSKNIVILAVDTITARKNVFKFYNNHSSNYILDLGNGKDYGQVVLSIRHCSQPKGSKYATVNVLRNIFQIHGKIKSSRNYDSCDVFDTLNTQGLMTNSIIAGIGAEMIWKLLNDKLLTYHGVYVNLKTMKIQ